MDPAFAAVVGGLILLVIVLAIVAVSRGGAGREQPTS
jgi:hypothetical protein